MALRALVGKLRSPPAATQAAASRAFSNRCEHCGKTSSRIAGSLGQKHFTTKDDLSLELKRYKRKHYIIRAVATVATLTMAGLILSRAVAYLEDDNNFQPRSHLQPKNFRPKK